MLSHIRRLPLDQEYDTPMQLWFFNQPSIQVNAVGFFDISCRLIPQVHKKNILILISTKFNDVLM